MVIKTCLMPLPPILQAASAKERTRLAGSQSLNKVVKELDKAAIMKLSVGAGLPAKHHNGIVYVGLDKQEWWWSHSLMGWVQNMCTPTPS